MVRYELPKKGKNGNGKKSEHLGSGEKVFTNDVLEECSQTLPSFFKVTPGTSLRSLKKGTSLKHRITILYNEGTTPKTHFSFSLRVVQNSDDTQHAEYLLENVFLIDTKINTEDAFFQQECTRGYHGWILFTCQ